MKYLALVGVLLASMAWGQVEEQKTPTSPFASVLPNTILANPTNANATAAAYSPLYITNMQAATSNAQVYVTLGTGAGQSPAYGSGQVIDGVTLAVGMEVFAGVATSGQTCGSGTTSNGTGGAIGGGGNSGYCVGKWTVVASGPWTRPVDYPDAYAFAANCNYAVEILSGTLYKGSVWRLVGSGSVDLAVLTFSNATLAAASVSPNPSNATYGSVLATTGVQSWNGTSGEIVPVIAAPVHAAFDCISADNTTTGGIGDEGNAAGTQGNCTTADPNGHPYLNGNGTAPTVSGTGCSLVSGSQDNRGSIVATGADTCTLNYAAFTTAPVCVVSGVGGTAVAPYVNAAPGTGSAVFKTAAAGTFAYVCL